MPLVICTELNVCTRKKERGEKKKKRKRNHFSFPSREVIDYLCNLYFLWLMTKFVLIYILLKGIKR